MKNRLHRRVCVFCLLLCLTLGISLSASAAVYTAGDDAGSADTVFVAGNPDCFPIEYFDEQSGCFRGVIPDMLSIISEKTGLSFTYISAGSENRQRELSRNNQAELITAIDAEGSRCSVSEIIPVLETARSDGEKTYCIGFTEIAPAETVESIKMACSEISEQDKMGLIVSNANNNPTVKKDQKIIRIIAIVVFALIAVMGIAAVVIARKGKSRDRDLLVDEDTGIGNDKYLAYAFENLLSPQSRNLYSMVYLALDVQKITGRYGEKAVGEFEKYAAAHLSAAIASAEYLAKVDDGVFVLLLQAVSEQESEEKTLGIVNGLNRYIQEFYSDIDDAFKAGVSRLCEHPDGNAETEFFSARQGYFSALNSGNAVEITGNDHLMQSKKQDKLRLQLQKAVKEDEFRVYMQFIAENRTERICGAEILSRWQNPEYGVLMPAEYIDLLKETGLIVEHDYKMFRALCRQLEIWNKDPLDSLFLTCNFTRISFSQKDFSDRICEISSGFSFDHSRLVIEVTEDSISKDYSVVSRNIQKCREMGFVIAIDDIGAGFSSLADLYDNEIELVKISGDFINSCTSDRRQTMLSDIIALVHRSGAKFICEGVETAEQAEKLSGINCDMMQGFYYSKVLPIVECERFLKSGRICENPTFKR